MANLLRFRLRQKPEVIEPPNPPDMLELAELYALRRDALDRGDLERVGELEQMVQEALDRNID
jgi:hypothetical protein